MKRNLKSVDRHEKEVAHLLGSDSRQKKNYWEDFYSTGDSHFLNEPSEIGRYGVITEIIMNMAKDQFCVLDIGCGDGGLCKILQPDTSQYIGIDIANAPIERAIKAFPECRFICSSFEDFGFGEAKYDVIILSEVIYYLEHKKTLQQAFDMLSENGFVIVSLYIAPSSGKIRDYILENAAILLHVKIETMQKCLGWEIFVIKANRGSGFHI